MLSTLMGTIGACTSGLGGRVETRTTGPREEQPFANLYTNVERASMTSPRIGNCAPIVIYGWRSPARSVPALYPPLWRS
jgi:hypothetical protein